MTLTRVSNPLRARALSLTFLAFQCSGPPSPCNACKGSDSECLFDESLDLRRKVAVRRSIAELEDSRNYYRDLLHALLASLRSPDPNTVDSLVSLIRSNASLPDIATLVADNAAHLGDVNAAESIRRGNSEDIPLRLLTRPFSDSHAHVTLEMLCDVPLFQVPAKPWTAVTDDNHLVSHLVSLYFTWDHPFSQVVDQDIFLAEMTKGDMGSGLCTPFLVNSILAMASVCSCQPMFLPTLVAILTLVDLLRFSKSLRHPWRFEYTRTAFLF